MFTCYFWLLQQDIIKFLVKAKEKGGIEQPVYLMPEPSSMGLVKVMCWKFPDREQGEAFYEWGIKANSYK